MGQSHSVRRADGSEGTEGEGHGNTVTEEEEEGEGEEEEEARAARKAARKESEER